MPSAFYCFLRCPDDLSETIVSSIVAGGDTDTRACIAGAISGAHNGVEAVPGRWLQDLPHRNGIEDVGRRLCHAVTHGAE